MFALISKDAGGAEIVSRYAYKQKEKFCLAVSGPAKKIFKKKFFRKKIMTRLNAIKQSDWVLCSTGTSSNFEKDAIILAKRQKKKVIAYIDHWTEYRSRFLKGKKLFLPDEIWVNDKHALAIAKKENLKPLKIKRNPFFSDFIKYKKKYDLKKKNSNKNNVLFLSEPVSRKLKKFYDEKKCLDYFLKNLSSLNLKIDKMQIRPHPSEKLDKFNWTKKYSKKILISKKNHIFNDILKNNIIVGINTVALVLGLIAKKKVISCIPVKKKCELPHKKIIDFKKFIHAYKKKN